MRRGDFLPGDTVQQQQEWNTSTHGVGASGREDAEQRKGPTIAIRFLSQVQRQAMPRPGNRNQENTGRFGQRAHCRQGAPGRPRGAGELLG